MRGWNTWNSYASTIDSALILESAQAIVDSGLAKVGYEYVNIDDTWQASSRMDNGTLGWDATKFPEGMPWLADQIHGLGLKAGLYSSAGLYTCAGYPAVAGYETIDAADYAKWGFDYLKLDNCFNQGQFGSPNVSYARYERMSNALNLPILYSLCQWGQLNPKFQDTVYQWSQTIANSYRIGGDIKPTFASVASIVEQAKTEQRAAAGWFGDMDMLEVGNEGMTFTEQVAHMTMWAINKSPLILGNDVRNMTDETLSIIANAGILAINQDSGTSKAGRVWSKDVRALPDLSIPSWQIPPNDTGGTFQLWSGSLTGAGKYLVALLNTSPRNLSWTIELDDAFNWVSYAAYGSVASQTYSALDVWASPATAATDMPANATRAERASVALGTDLTSPVCGNIPDVTVEAHGVRLFVLTPTNATCGTKSAVANRMMGRKAWSPEPF